MTEPVIDQLSLPPAVLMAAPRSASRMRVRVPAGGGPAAAAPAGTDDTGGQAPSLRLTAGPSGYTTAVKAADRPRNLEELAARVDLDDTAPWPAGAAVPIGTRGKRAHWTGTEWKGGDSPGYRPEPPVLEPPVQLTETPALDAPAATPAPAAQFPGDGGDSPEELHR